MIVPMKKVTLLALGSEQNQALTALRGLGVMQVETARRVPSETSQQLGEEFDNGRRVVAALEKLRAELDEAETGKLDSGSGGSGAETIEEAGRLIDSREQLLSEANAVDQRLAQLAVWGDFNRATLDELRNKGVFVTLCCGNEEALEAAEALEGARCEIISMEDRRIYFAVISTEKPAEGTLPEVRLSEQDDPAKLRSRKKDLAQALDEVGYELRSLLQSLPAAKRRLAVLGAELEFSQVRDSLGQHGAVVSLQGFVPVPALADLEAEARRQGWGLLVEDPGPDDRVPTLLKVPKLVQVINPLFQFLGIAPGYDEIDVSAGVLVFFTIFYAMIVGDAGYGLIFLAGALFAGWKFRGNPAAKTPVRLLTILSVATIIWGVLSSNFFGLPMPWWMEWATVPALTDEVTKNQNTQYFCFILAVAQLSLGRIWRALHDGTVRSIVRNLGWTLVIIANFFLTIKLIVYPGAFPQYMYWLYGVGLVMVVFSDVDWKNPADIFQFPFNIIGSFVDVLSYIRLFAVGMAGFYIASSFNGMGVNICKYSPLLLLAGVVVIVFGHVLNLALCVMSVMVHGVRLNTLEFSNHIGLRWAGSTFKPFKNIKKSEEN